MTADEIPAELFSEQARVNPCPLYGAPVGTGSLFLRGVYSVPITLN